VWLEGGEETEEKMEKISVSAKISRTVKFLKWIYRAQKALDLRQIARQICER